MNVAPLADHVSNHDGCVSSPTEVDESDRDSVAPLADHASNQADRLAPTEVDQESDEDNVAPLADHVSNHDDSVAPTEVDHESDRDSSVAPPAADHESDHTEGVAPSLLADPLIALLINVPDHTVAPTPSHSVAPSDHADSVAPTPKRCRHEEPQTVAPTPSHSVAPSDHADGVAPSELLERSIFNGMPMVLRRQPKIVLVSDDDEPVVRVPPMPSYMPDSMVPYWSWNRMPFILDTCHMVYTDPTHDVLWSLAAPTPDTLDVVRTTLFDHVKNVVYSQLELPAFQECHFKIGITYKPHTRFRHSDYLPLKRIVFAYTSENSDMTARLEKECIARFRTDCFDKRLENIHPGGENAHIGVSPFFICCAGHLAPVPARTGHNAAKRVVEQSSSFINHRHQTNNSGVVKPNSGRPSWGPGGPSWGPGGPLTSRRGTVDEPKRLESDPAGVSPP